jgi:hypothetical protein
MGKMSSRTKACLEVASVLLGLRCACLLEADAASDPTAAIEAANTLISSSAREDFNADFAVLSLSGQKFVVDVKALSKKAEKFPFAFCETAAQVSKNLATSSAAFESRSASLSTTLLKLLQKISETAVGDASAGRKVPDDEHEDDWEGVSRNKRTKPKPREAGGASSLGISRSYREMTVELPELAPCGAPPCCLVALTAALLEYPCAYWATNEKTGEIDTSGLQGQTLILCSTIYTLRGSPTPQEYRATFSVPLNPPVGIFYSNCGDCTDVGAATGIPSSGDPAVKALLSAWMEHLRTEAEKRGDLSVSFEFKTVTPERVVL